MIGEFPRVGARWTMTTALIATSRWTGIHGLCADGIAMFDGGRYGIDMKTLERWH